jgi:hypothetical protein
MAGQCAQAFTLRNAPNLGRCVVAPGHDNVSVYLKASDTGLMANEDVFALALLKVPYPESSVA